MSNCFNDPKYFSNGDDQVKPDDHENEELNEEKAPGLEMEDFLISEEEPESLNQYLERKNSE